MREVYGEVLCDWRYVVKFYVMVVCGESFM